MSEDRTIPTSAPADRPSFTILVGGTQISGEYQVQGVVVSREYNRISSADIFIFDGDPATEDFTVSNAQDFIPGGEIEIKAGYHSDEETIFKGLILKHGIKVYKDKPSVLRIECKDKSIKMTIGRKSKYYYESTDADIMEEIAADSGVDTDIESTNVTHAQMVKYYVSDWDFILTRSEANGKLVTTDDGSLIIKAPDGSSEPVLSLTYGGNMLEFEAVMDASYQLSSIQSYAWNAADQEMFQIEAASATVTTPGNISVDDLSNVIELEEYQLKHAGQVRDDELQAWADGRSIRTGYGKIRGRARIQGFVGVKPGHTVELAGVGDRFNGTALVSGVQHEINSKNWETQLTFGLSPDIFSETQKDIAAAQCSGLLPGISGLQVGLVTALEGDPDGEDRIQIRIPMIDPAEQGTWARVASLDAGDSRGVFFRPEIDDEVVVGFFNDDPRNPVVLGMVHSSAKPAPITASDDNHEKGIITRSEMKMIFDDEKISFTFETPNGNKLSISDEDGEIVLADENDNVVTLNADGITIESAADINIKAGGDINLEGSNISSMASTEFKAEGSSGAKFSSGGSTVIEGSIVQIN
jgi:Rhs element Vgr protein